ncbi:MAG: GYD domain-containing protein [Alsobacter sp.]
MTFYLIEASYSPAALKAMVDHPQDRVAVVSAMVEKAGGRLHHFFFTMGDTDIVALAEVPDDTDAMAISLAVASAGHMTSYRTRRLTTSDDAMKAMRKAQSISLPPPR